MSRRLSTLAALAGVCLVVTGCVPTSRPVPAPAGLTRCVGERPEVCAQLYEPVCATSDPGLATRWKAYSNACMACADPDVQAWRAGACREG